MLPPGFLSAASTTVTVAITFTVVALAISGRIEKCASRETHLSVLADFEHFNPHDVANLEFVFNLVDPTVGNLRNVQETVLTRNDFDECPECEDTLNFALDRKSVV